MVGGLCRLAVDGWRVVRKFVTAGRRSAYRRVFARLAWYQLCTDLSGALPATVSQSLAADTEHSLAHQILSDFLLSHTEKVLISLSWPYWVAALLWVDPHCSLISPPVKVVVKGGL